jgi:2,5-diketo-D-gluconate reductase B
MKVLRLNENTSIPILGLGTWMLNGDVCTKAVLKAFEIGYRHIDTADMYGNHKAIAKAIKESGLKREDFLVTPILFPTTSLIFSIP